MCTRGERVLPKPSWPCGVLGLVRSLRHACCHAANPSFLPSPCTMQASSWLLTCFAADFPFHFAARVMDVLLTGHQVASPVLKASLCGLPGGMPCS